MRTLKEISGGGTAVTLTGLDAEVIGQKAIIQDGKLIYASQESPWTQAVWSVYDDISKNGMIKTAHGNIFYETLQKKKHLIICGGGHVANAVLLMAKLLDIQVTVLEDRKEFAAEAVQAGAERVIWADFAEGLRQIELDESAYVLVMTRGHCHDRECLRYLLTCEYGYLGLLGSGKRGKRLKEELEAEGYSKEKLDKIYTPVGLKIYAETPGEIAVSILAEIIRLKNSSCKVPAYEKPLEEYLFGEMLAEGQKRKRRAVLATIIEKQGSVPRGVGTKMIQFEDGSTLGTVGGGFLEAEVMRRARICMQEDSGNLQVQTITISSEKSAEEGMFCGGTATVILERLE